MIANHVLRRVSCCLLLLMAVAFCPECAAQYLSPAIHEAAEAARMGKASRSQKALLFQNNDAINQARLGGWLPNSTYQAAQREYSALNQKFAQSAAESTGAGFTVQTSNSPTYSPGTDSDYIVTTTGNDPVGQIREMQTRYNEHVNSYLEDALGSEGYQHVPKDNWHNRLDVDFMADPAHVTDEQFRQIAELNNDAYTRRGSAELERRSRPGGVEIDPEHFTDYANEMQDFIDRKQVYLDRINKDPTLLRDPQMMAEHHRLMAQEQKYTSRIQAANRMLREQEDLPVPPKTKGPPAYEIIQDSNGNATIRQRPVGTLAERGARRSATNRATTIAASGVAQNSVQQAVTDLSESMAEAAANNPDKWPDAQAQIADLSDRLPPSAKGELLERIAAQREAHALSEILSDAGELDDAGMAAARARARRAGNDYSRGVAQEMQARVRASRPSMAGRMDDAIRSSLGVTDDIGGLQGMRGTLNRRASTALGGLDRLGAIGTAMEVYDVASTGFSILSNISRARDPNTSAADARVLYDQARADMLQLGSSGLMAGISYAMPTAGAMIGGYDMGYAAGRFVLDNTAAGQAVDQGTLETFDAIMRASETAWDRLTELVGGESQRMLDEERQRNMEAAYWRALREGRIRTRPGVMTTDIVDIIRSGNLAGLRDLIEPGPNASQGTTDRLVGNPVPEEPKKNLNDDLEWINQTFEPAGDTQAREDYQRMTREGNSPFGPVVNPHREEGIVTDIRPDYRARAEEIVRNSGKPAASYSTEPNYRQNAERIHNRVVAIEQERARQARIAEARRQEMIRQQQIAAQRARQQAWANEVYRRQQVAQQQAAWNARQQQWQQQQRWQQQQQWQQRQQQQQRPSVYIDPSAFDSGLLPFPE